VTAAQVAILVIGGLVASLVVLVIVLGIDLVTVTPARAGVTVDEVPKTERLLLGDQHGTATDITMPTGRAYVTDTPMPADAAPPAPLVVDSPPSARGLIPVRDLKIIPVPSCSYCRDGEHPLTAGRPCAWCGRGIPTPITDEGAPQMIMPSSRPHPEPLPPRDDEPIYRQVLADLFTQARHDEAREQVTA